VRKGKPVLNQVFLFFWGSCGPWLMQGACIDQICYTAWGCGGT